MNKRNKDKLNNSSGTEKYEILIRLSENETKCYLHIKTKPGADEPELSDLKRKLKENEVKYGIIKENLNKIIDKKQYDQDVLVAQGVQPVPGKDAEIEYLIDFEKTGKPEIDELGNVNFYEINIINSVKKGEKLAKKRPPIEGKEGITVKNEKIEPPSPSDTIIPSGKNTVISPDDKNILIAAIDGCVKLRNNKIVDVEPVFIVKGDVNFSTGNIDFMGSVIVKGDLISGFKIKAGGDVQIDGVVEDAKIEAKGDVLVKLGFTGKGNGEIVAGGNAILKYCENQVLSARQDVIISEYIINGYVKAGERILVTGKSGVIVGGVTIALKGVEVNNLGSRQNIKTSVYIGITEEIRNKYNKINAELRKTKEQLENITEGINILMKIKLLKKVFSKENENILKRLKETKGLILTDREKLIDEKKKLLKEIENYKSATIKVYNVLYSNVRIHITNKRYYNQHDIKNVMFFLADDGIGYKPLE